ncbi:MAG TPA: alpha-galactosidase [Gemmatimonadales bacterium]|nr:alpha-galactosidase [Gemmatimonadales bacterium]
MDRRTFLLLTGAGSAALITPPERLSARAPRQTGGRAVARLRFELDDQRRWSLWYQGDGPPVPLIAAAELGAWVGERLVTFAELEDITVGHQAAAGETLLVRGRSQAAGVWLEAQLTTSEPAPVPLATLRFAVYPDRYLPAVRGLRFFQSTAAQMLPGTGDLVALVNGYHSWDACSVAHIAPDSAFVSHGALGLTRAGAGLALAWDPGEPGEAKVTCSGGGLEAISDWLPARPLRATGDASVLRLAYDPAGDGLSALRVLFAPAAPVDQERFAALTVPAGWCSWYELYGGVTEADILANLDVAAATFDRRFFRLVQLDDGYQKATGDWDTNAKFPRGHRALTDQIHAKGFKAGLWVAPFAVTDRSGVPVAHPDWLLQKGGQPIVWDTRADWGGKVYSLDGAHPGVQDWLERLGRRVVQDWGYDYLKIDFLLWAAAGDAHHGSLTHAEAYRAGLRALRTGLGPDVFLLGCGAPLQHAAGLVDGMRIGTDVDATWTGLQAPARAAALRSFYHRGAWLNDPDCLVVRAPLSDDEARAWAAITALSGGLTVFSDNLPKVAAERLRLLQRTIPVATAAGRPIGTTTAAPDLAPALVAGDRAVPIGGPWRFKTGDAPAYAEPAFEDATWETIPVPSQWEQAGHPGYDGVAWYRTRFTLPRLPIEVRMAGAPPVLELGKLDDDDETYVNGVWVGATRGWSAYRRYAVPPDVLRWGTENTLAVRVTDGGGPGGFWSVRRDQPPAAWIAAGGERWWTVALINWDDAPRDVTLALRTLGLPAGRYDAYDVWRDAPLAPVRDAVAAYIPPHTSHLLALRPSTSRPQVIGSTRHLVQGAIDVAGEAWDANTRTLSARATNLDAREYAITIRVPDGWRAASCEADVACHMEEVDGHVILKWAGGEGRDVRWQVRFRREPNRHK